MSEKQVRSLSNRTILNKITKTYIPVTEITDEVSENAQYLYQKYQMNGQDTYRNR